MKTTAWWGVPVSRHSWRFFSNHSFLIEIDSDAEVFVLHSKRKPFFPDTITSPGANGVAPELVTEQLDKVFGLQSYSLAARCENEIDAIKAKLGMWGLGYET